MTFTVSDDYDEQTMQFNGSITYPKNASVLNLGSKVVSNFTTVYTEPGWKYLLKINVTETASLEGGNGNFSYEKYFVYNGHEYSLSGTNCAFIVEGNGSGVFSYGLKYNVFVMTTTLGSNINACHVTIKPHLQYTLYRLSASEMANFDKSYDVDSSVKEGNKLQEKNNDLQQEANETSKGILGKITDFFSSFFENIINALKSLFIPEDGYFSDFFNRLNDLFSEKLGFLYSPIDLFVSFLNAIQNVSVGSSPGLVFPELKWEDTVLIPETNVNFDLVNEKFPELQQKIYFVTDIIMVGAVIVLLERKIDEVMHK